MGLRSEVLDPKYIFEHDLGLWNFGAMGVLKERKTGAQKLCKTVSKALVPDRGAALTRLRQLQNLKHPHLCAIYEVLEDGQNFFILTEKLRGGDIENWLNDIDESTHWLAEQTVAAYICQALVALAHCHSINAFHNDLKPNNVLLSSKLPDAVVMVSDMGLASILDPESRTLRRSPNPYAAPELLAGSRRVAGGSADMWSIGAIAQALLIGRRPEHGWRPSSGALAGVAQTFGFSGVDDAWIDRSPQSRDFVDRLLQPAGDRPTAARMLQHPWMRTIVVPRIRDGLSADYGIKDVNQKTLCYVLATLIAPGLLGHAELSQLRRKMVEVDTDYDGLVVRRVAAKLLQGCGVTQEQAMAALALADVRATGVIDLCGTTVALVLVRMLLGKGAAGFGFADPLDPRVAAPALTERLFEVCGCSKAKPTILTSELAAKLRTPTGRELEEFAGVKFDEMLSSLPEDSELDRRTLVQGLTAGGGRGTPASFGFRGAQDSDAASASEGEHQDGADSAGACWAPAVSLAGAISYFLTSTLQSCGVGVLDGKDRRRRGGRSRGMCSRFAHVLDYDDDEDVRADDGSESD